MWEHAHIATRLLHPAAYVLQHVLCGVSQLKCLGRECSALLLTAAAYSNGNTAFQYIFAGCLLPVEWDLEEA